jgi:hypothetical protein
MLVTDEEIDRIVRRMLALHGLQAAVVAAERLNSCIDHSNWRGRDIWACVVRRIHEDRDSAPK